VTKAKCRKSNEIIYFTSPTVGGEFLGGGERGVSRGEICFGFLKIVRILNKKITLHLPTKRCLNLI
jgi:hypothetical protein